MHFVGSEFLHDLHVKCFTLLGMSRDQIFLQRCCAESVGASSDGPASSSFKKRYLDLDEYCPSSTIGQNAESFAACFAKGFIIIIIIIIIIKSASYGAKIPSIISWFQVLVSEIIKESTVASAIESRIGELIFGGCLIGSHLCCQILIDLPSPTHQQAPSRITSRPLRMLFQAYEPTIDSFQDRAMREKLGLKDFTEE